jgi:hypothetical protein
MVRETTVELCALGVIQRCGSGLSGNAVPKIFNERQALFDAESVDT